MIFTELMRFVEQAGGPVLCDAVILKADLPNDGAFTSVGNYPSAHAVAIVSAAAELTGLDANRLCEDYGSFLFDRLTELMPQVVSRYGSSTAMLNHVASHIHEEVRVLYPDAKPPLIEAEEDGEGLLVRYESHRPFAHIAFGLIRRCLLHYGDDRVVSWERSTSPYSACFRVAKPQFANA